MISIQLVSLNLDKPRKTNIMIYYKQESKKLPKNQEKPISFLIDWKISNDPIAISYQVLDKNGLIGTGTVNFSSILLFFDQTILSSQNVTFQINERLPGYEITLTANVILRSERLSLMKNIKNSIRSNIIKGKKLKYLI